jgi:hypothetical protein
MDNPNDAFAWKEASFDIGDDASSVLFTYLARDYFRF